MRHEVAIQQITEIDVYLFPNLAPELSKASNAALGRVPAKSAHLVPIGHKTLA
jgi:hypothetical protein